MYGIDVSEFQYNVDFEKVKKSGVDFVMVRAGFGSTTMDAYFEQNVYNAKKSGLHVGAYYFVYACDETEAKNNADNFIRLLSKFKGSFDFPVACDFEYDSVDYMRECGVKPTKELCTRIVKTFCERVEQAGYYVMNYANLDFIYNYFNDLSRFDLWLAQWDSKASLECGIWQYTSRGTVNGINKPVDLDISYIDYPKLLKEKGLNHLSNNETKPTKPVEEKPKQNTSIKKGDTVEVTNPIIYGTNKKFTLYYKKYKVLEVVGKRAVIGIGNTVTSAIDVKYLRKV